MITHVFGKIDVPLGDPERGPMLIFRDVSPIYLKVNFLKWCEIGLKEVAGIRRLEARVIKHLRSEFVGLINALYCMAGTNAYPKKFGVYYDEYIKRYYKKDVEEDDMVQPADFCIAFFRAITCESAQSAVWLLYEIVTAAKDKYGYQPEQTEVLDLFGRYNTLLGVANSWQQLLAKDDQFKKKPGKNDKRKPK